MAAGFALAIVDIEFLFEVARVAVLTNKVTQGGASLVDGFLQHLFDLHTQLGKPSGGDVTRLSPGVDAAAEQGLAGVDIADANDHLVIHDVLLDRGFPVPTGC